MIPVMIPGQKILKECLSFKLRGIVQPLRNLRPVFLERVLTSPPCAVFLQLRWQLARLEKLRCRVTAHPGLQSRCLYLAVF
jgi:hypothetical protein